MPKLDACKYSILDGEKERKGEEVQKSLSNIEVLIKGCRANYAQLNIRYRKALEALVTEYATLVGPEVSARMLLAVD